MRFGIRLLSLLALLSFIGVDKAGAVDLKGSVSVRESSETAADAKINAVNSARRQILTNVLSKYADANVLKDLIQNTSSDVLANLISSSSVSNEQISNDTYSATISMNIDNDIAKQWLISNNVQNWVPSADSGERFSLFIVVQNGIVDWAELKRIAREDKVEIETISMQGNQIVAKMPLNYRTKFTAQIREYGWRYTDNSGILQIWK